MFITFNISAARRVQKIRGNLIALALFALTAWGHHALADIDTTGIFSFSQSVTIRSGQQPVADDLNRPFNLSEIYLASDYYNQAQCFYNSEHFDQAAMLWEKAAYHYGSAHDWHSYTECLIMIGKCYASQNNQKMVTAILIQAMDVVDYKLPATDLLHADVHQDLGVALLKQGQKSESIPHFKEAIAIRSEFSGEHDRKLADAYNKLGVSYYMTGELDKALDAYYKGLDISNHVNIEPIVIAEICNNIGIVLKLKGDLVEALKYYHHSVELKEQALSPDDPQLARTYNNLGNLHRVMGQSEMAMVYYEKAEAIFKAKFGPRYPMVGKIYANMGIIYTINGDYGRAMQYLNYAMNILEGDESSADEIASVYNNLGNVHYELKNYDQALYYYSRSVDLREQGASMFLPRSYSNIGLCYYELEQFREAERYHQLSVDCRKRYFGDNHYLLAAEYLNYGQFFINTGNKQKGLNLYLKAHDIYVANYGDKHPNVSSCLVNIGDFYRNEGDLPAALRYYQESICAIISGFNNSTDLYSNPDLAGRILSKTELLNSLSRKASALKEYYQGVSHDPKDIQMSLTTFELALNLMDHIRIGHMTSESKLELAKNQKQLFRNAVQTAFEAYQETGDPYYQDLSFQFAERGKAAMLYDFIRENDAKHFAHIPDSLINREHKLKEDLTVYQKLVYDEILKTASERDSVKLAMWEQKVFELQLARNGLVQYFNTHYPKYYQYKYTNKTVTIADIRANLNANDAFIEYFLDNDILYTFFITSQDMRIIESSVDSSLYGHIDDLPNNQTLDQILNDAYLTYTNYLTASGQLYKILLEPVEELIAGKNLIIIPDGILGYVSFESLLTDEHSTASVDYKHLPYLIRSHTINYGYSGTLYVNSLKAEKSGKASEDLIAFAPVIFNKERMNEISDLPIYRTRGEELLDLPATRKEVLDIRRILKGDVFLNGSATVTKFKELAANYRILHIATHGIVDNNNPLYSRLVFSPVTEETDGGCLHYSDLFNLELNADLAVLSACNTGYGRNSEGEGIIALARGFLYSGVPSLVISLWSVEDESTAQIMKQFYRYLKDGYSKDEALRRSKLDYLQTTNSIGASPYYWSGFVNIGNNQPMLFARNNMIASLLLISLLIPTALLIIYIQIRRARRA